ncbi:MAG: hypothetical protein ABJG41_13935 [Cyclobacteriaceae bacterium]
MKKKQSLLFAVFLLFLISCKDNDTPEVAAIELKSITDVVLVFKDSNGGKIETVAINSGSEGTSDFVVADTVLLKSNEYYRMIVEIVNVAEQRSFIEVVVDAAIEHMFFYSWTEGVFNSPSGNGNIDSRSDPLNYEDFDYLDRPLGLTTSWTTGAVGVGEFRVVLKNQRGLKSTTSTVADGITDMDITFPIKIVE